MIEIRKSLFNIWHEVTIEEAREWARGFLKSLHFVTPKLIEAGNRRVRGISFEELIGGDQ